MAGVDVLLERALESYGFQLCHASELDQLRAQHKLMADAHDMERSEEEWTALQEAFFEATRQGDKNQKMWRSTMREKARDTSVRLRIKSHHMSRAEAGAAFMHGFLGDNTRQHPSTAGSYTYMQFCTSVDVLIQAYTHEAYLAFERTASRCSACCSRMWPTARFCSSSGAIFVRASRSSSLSASARPRGGCRGPSNIEQCMPSSFPTESGPEQPL